MNMQTTQPNLTKQIAILSFPIIVENLLQALLGTVDTWFAGQLDDTAIAAIGATTLVFNLFLTFYTAISIGASAIIARCIGEQNKEKACLRLPHAGFVRMSSSFQGYSDSFACVSGF